MKEKLSENELKMIKNQIFDDLLEIDKNNIYQIFNSLSFYNFNQIRIKILKESFDIKISENREILIYSLYQDKEEKLKKNKKIFQIDYDFLEIERISSILYQILENYHNQKENILL